MTAVRVVPKGLFSNTLAENISGSKTMDMSSTSCTVIVRVADPVRRGVPPSTARRVMVWRRRVSKSKDDDKKRDPVVEFMKNRELGSERVKVMSALVPRSASEALAVKMTEPVDTSSLTLMLYTSWVNTGA